MNMDKQEGKTYSSQRGRIPQSAAQGLDIVPVEPASSSDNGLSLALSASVGPETAFVEEIQGKEESATRMKQEESQGLIMIPGAAPNAEGTEECLIERIYTTPCERDIETMSSVSTFSVSDNVAMECEEQRASKRKKSLPVEQQSSESEDEALRRTKISRRRRIMDDDGNVSSLNKEQSRSNPDISLRPSEEEPKIAKMRKGYISKQKGLEIEEAKEEIATEKRDEIRQKREEKAKAEEEKKKKGEKIKAEMNIIAKIGTKSADEREYIENMTASDLAAMALEYLDHVEIIRTKCGTMQGALSGELKRRKVSLDNMIRALQAKAEEKGDPHFLKAKIEELIKKNREEEERKKREISELKHTVANLAKENKEMRKELNLIRQSIERRNSKERRDSTKREYGAHLPEENHSKRGKENRRLVNDTYREEEISSDIPRCPTTQSKEVPRCPAMQSKDEVLVMRPPLGGKTVHIPNSNLKQKNMVNRVKDNKEKPVIKVIENIQLRPPRREDRSGQGETKDRENKEERETSMEWEDNGISWCEMEEDEAGKKVEEEVLRVTDKKKEETWKEVVRKGRKKNEKSLPAKKVIWDKQNLPKKAKRKMPKTAAVSIKGDTKQGFSYAEVLRKARSQIKMEDLQIEAPRIRKGLNGATIIEISGPECNDKAQKLASKLQEVLREDKAAITTPTIRGELRIAGLDESIGKEEIGWAIEEEGGCASKDIRIGEIRKTRRGMGIVWVQCPLKAAIEIAKRKKIKVGWTVVGVTLLEARPLQCFRCWHHGHVKDQCRSKVDRSKNCFQCGREGHNAASCSNKVSCAICTDLGMENTHRVGSIKCEGIKTKAAERNLESERRTDFNVAE